MSAPYVLIAYSAVFLLEWLTGWPRNTTPDDVAALAAFAILTMVYHLWAERRTFQRIHSVVDEIRGLIR